LRFVWIDRFGNHQSEPAPARSGRSAAMILTVRQKQPLTENSAGRSGRLIGHAIRTPFEKPSYPVLLKRLNRQVLEKLGGVRSHMRTGLRLAIPC
jgi:hypothetical protein